MRLGLVHAQGIGNKRSAIQVVDEQGLQFQLARLAQGLQDFRRYFGICQRQDFTGLHIDCVPRKHLSDEVLLGDFQFLDAGFFKVSDVSYVDTLFAFYDDVSILVRDIERDRFSAQPFCNQVQVYTVFVESEPVSFKEDVQDILGGVAQCLQ